MLRLLNHAIATPLLSAVVLVLFVAAGACNRSPTTRIGVAPKSVSQVFWQYVHAGAVAAGREADVEIDWRGPPQETDFSRQIEIVDSMINSRLDGIVVAPTEPTSLSPVVERAMPLGIPVSIFDSGINTSEYVSYVATNNYEAGVSAARKLGEILNGKGKVAMVKMVPGAASTLERESGFEQTLAKEFPEITKVAEQYCLSDRARALAVSENMLTAHPDLDALFASAEAATVGAAQALKARQLSGRVTLVGFDFSDTIEQDLKDGVIDALVVQDPFNIGYEAVMTIVAKLRGETPPKRIDSPAYVVTVESLTNPQIDKALRPDVRQYLE